MADFFGNQGGVRVDLDEVETWHQKEDFAHNDAGGKIFFVMKSGEVASLSFAYNDLFKHVVKWLDEHLKVKYANDVLLPTEPPEDAEFAQYFVNYKGEIFMDGASGIIKPYVPEEAIGDCEEDCKYYKNTGPSSACLDCRRYSKDSEEEDLYSVDSLLDEDEDETVDLDLGDEEGPADADEELDDNSSVECNATNCCYSDDVNSATCEWCKRQSGDSNDQDHFISKRVAGEKLVDASLPAHVEVIEVDNSVGSSEDKPATRPLSNLAAKVLPWEICSKCAHAVDCAKGAFEGREDCSKDEGLMFVTPKEMEAGTDNES